MVRMNCHLMDEKSQSRRNCGNVDARKQRRIREREEMYDERQRRGFRVVLAYLASNRPKQYEEDP